MSESPDKKPPQDPLDWLGLSASPNWSAARPLGRFVGAILILAVPLLFLGALVAAGAVLWHTIALALSGGSEGINLGAGALIAALLGAPFVIWGTVLKYQTVRYQKEGHMTDRLAKAVEQLGAEKTVKTEGKEETRPNLEVRMGAILSLERIAQDSTTHDRGRDHVMVMQILCEYIRENSNARKPRDFPLSGWKPLEGYATPDEREDHEEALRQRTISLKTWTRSLPNPRADVQLALKVIGRRSARQRLVEAAWPDPYDQTTRWPFDPDFPRLADEPGEAAMTLEQIETFKAGLEAWQNACTDYRGYRLDLRGANLQRADLAAGQPDGSDAVFSGARLDGARMEGARLDAVRMVGASPEGAPREGSRLHGARMEGASLDGTWMQGASLREARMEGTSLVGVPMMGASLYRARMDGAELRKTNLTESLHLTTEQLATAFGDASVRLPEGLDPPAHWSKRELDNLSFFAEHTRWRSNPAAYTPPDP